MLGTPRAASASFAVGRGLASSRGFYRYTAFGKTLEDTATANLNQPLRWKGRPLEVVGGLEIYDMRARQWAPELGAFLSVDEFQYADAMSTLWGWPGQNPYRWSDPSGRKGAVRNVSGMFFAALDELASTSRDATAWWASQTADAFSSGDYGGAAVGAAVTYGTGVAAFNLTWWSGTLPHAELAVAMAGSCPSGGRGARPPNMSPPGAGRSGAFRAAKAASGVARSQQPSRVTPNLDRQGNPQPGRQYIFNEGRPNEVIIREDSAGHEYGPGDPQNRGPHFNDPSGNHYDY